MFPFEKLNHFGTFTTPLEEILLASMGIYTLVGMVADHATTLIRDPRFWVSVSMVVYSLGVAPAFTIEGIAGVAITVDDVQRFYSINWVLSSVANILYAMAFLADRTKAGFEKLPTESHGP